ncbi:hypothetical protein ACV229_16915 [Burkholderia sp. MR1-5-21]
MNYRTKNRLGLAVVAFLAVAIMLAALMDRSVGTAAPVDGHPHAQQR